MTYWVTVKATQSRTDICFGQERAIQQRASQTLTIVDGRFGGVTLHAIFRRGYVLFMPSRHALTVSLTPELARLVAANVTSGGYGSASEVVRAGLRLLFAAALDAHDPKAQAALKRVGSRAIRMAARAEADRG